MDPVLRDLSADRPVDVVAIVGGTTSPSRHRRVPADVTTSLAGRSDIGVFSRQLGGPPQADQPLRTDRPGVRLSFAR